MKNLRIWQAVGLAAAAVLLVAAPALAQTGTSQVTGQVLDKTGAVIVGASVTLTNEATKVSFTTSSTSAGTYVIEGVQPGQYKITFEMKGFKTFVSTGNAVTIGQPAVVNATLEVGAVGEVIDVKEGAELVQTTSSGNFGNLVDQVAVTTLPIVGLRGRNPLQFVELQPGVVDGGPNIAGGGVSVHGSRDRAWNYTLDGIDINETSAGGANFSPLRTNPDSIAQFRVLTSNFTSEYGRNSGAEVLMVTRSGTNEFHGTGFFFYQTPGLLANDPGNKAATPPLARPQFVQKIGGFSLGGPIIKNKTFFFTNLQFLRTLQTVRTTSSVYTDSARNGTFRYVTGGNCGSPCRNRPAGTTGASVDSSGNVAPGVTVGTYNVAANDKDHAGSLDPTIQSILKLTPLPNNFGVGDGLNVAGFDFLASQLEKQADWVIKIDHAFSPRHLVFVRWAHGHQNTDGDTVNNGSAPFPGAPPVVGTHRSPRNLAVNWRWNPSAQLTNEFVVGMNRFIFDFLNPDADFAKNLPFVLNNVTLPRQNYVGNKRALTTYQLADNMSYVRGAHNLKWGINFRYQRHIDDRGSIGSLNAAPSVTLDPSINDVGAGFNLPTNINATFDTPTLKATINDLLGRVGEIDQGLVALNDSQFAPAGSHLSFDFRMPEYDFYAQDSWRIRSNLVVDVGLRWEIRLSPGNPHNAILRPDQAFGAGATPSNTLKWVPGQLYKDSWGLLGPSIGFAWDPFNTGKMSIRANYRLAHDRMNTFSLSSGVFQSLPGLTLQLTDRSFGQAGGRIRDGVPVLTVPAGVTPTQLRQPAAFSTSSITVVDPNWKPSQVHEWGLSIQRQIGRSMVAEVNYIGRRGVHLYGGYDANQVEIFSNGFLDAFKIVQAGGDSTLINQLLANDSRRRTGETGSQMLRRSGSPYSSAFNLGSVAAVAAAIAQRTQGGVPLVVLDGLSPFFFMAFPQFTGAFNVLDSRDISTYHAFEAQIRRQFSGGLSFQASYTLAKSLDSRSFDPTFSRVSRGAAQSASSTPFDLRNRNLNYAPSDFDRTHVFQANWVWELPFGQGHRWGRSWNGVVERLLGGWEIAGIVTLETGRPFTVYSPANTVSQVVRSPANCSGCSPHMGQIHFDPAKGTNVYFTPEQIALFSTPAVGQLGNVGRNSFRLGGFRGLDMTIGKITRITERQKLETRLEIQNLTNSVMYDLSESSTFNSSVFGRLNPTNIALTSNPRRMQIAVKYLF